MSYNRYKDIYIDMIVLDGVRVRIDAKTTQNMTSIDNSNEK